MKKSQMMKKFQKIMTYVWIVGERGYWLLYIVPALLCHGLQPVVIEILETGYIFGDTI
jgi:hypothetical protein